MSYKLVLKTILFSILTTLSQIGCTIYYSTDSLNGKLKTNIDKVNNNCISVTDKINEMHKQYLSLNCKTDTKPFQTAKEQLEKTEFYTNFKQKCVDVYIYLRKHAKLIISLMQLMADAGKSINIYINSKNFNRYKRLVLKNYILYIKKVQLFEIIN